MIIYQLHCFESLISLKIGLVTGGTYRLNPPSPSDPWKLSPPPADAATEDRQRMEKDATPRVQLNLKPISPPHVKRRASRAPH